MQQTVLHSSKHWPFTKEYNKEGIVQGEKVLEALDKAGVKDAFLMFEIGHREHYDTDFRVIEDLKESVDYWRGFVKA